MISINSSICRLIVLVLSLQCIVTNAFSGSRSGKWSNSPHQMLRVVSRNRFSTNSKQTDSLQHFMATATTAPFSPSSSSSASSLTTTGSHTNAFTPAAENIRPSITDRARTITYICTGGTLCTSSVMDGVQGYPFGSYVDYILDEQGSPILLLSEQSLHTQNIQQNAEVSLFIQLPRSHQTQTSAALSRVTVMGKIEAVPADQMTALKMAFAIVHSYAEQIVDSKKFKLVRIQPEKIYFSGGFGVQATWVNIQEYQSAKPDVLAQDVPNVLSRINVDKQQELYLLCKHYLKLEHVDFARIQAIDRLGIDIRVQSGDYTDEYRVGFRHPVNSAEDAKSELTKLFQEVWEREQGYFFTEDLPPVKKYAEDILRSNNNNNNQK